MTTLQDLGLAYRKAKVDLYYSSHASLDAIADYEENLHTHLSALMVKLQGDDETWVTQPEFIGGWTLATKSVDMSCWEQHREQHGNGLIFSSPAEEWAHACALLAEGEKPQKPKAEFRVMAQCSLDFHVLSTLWMLEVGHRFDAKLTGCAYGNRLRRTQEGKLNQLSLGTFQPYLKPFRDWRDKGIEAMRTALDAGEAEEAELRARAAELEEKIDRQERDAEDLCLRLLLLQQPVAGDLRVISSALKMVTDMKRIGDQSADIAEIVTLANISQGDNTLNIHDMAVSAIKMVTDSVDAFVGGDTALARAVIECDDVVDSCFDGIKKRLIEMFSLPETDGEYAIDLLMIAKYLERIADHAVNIADWVLFSITGERGALDNRRARRTGLTARAKEAMIRHVL